MKIYAITPNSFSLFHYRFMCTLRFIENGRWKILALQNLEEFANSEVGCVEIKQNIRSKFALTIALLTGT